MTSRKIKFPLWQFLRQPIFVHRSQTVLNPRRFWYLHQIAMLERCLAKDCAPNRHDRSA